MNYTREIHIYELRCLQYQKQITCLNNKLARMRKAFHKLAENEKLKRVRFERFVNNKIWEEYVMRHPEDK